LVGHLSVTTAHAKDLQPALVKSHLGSLLNIDHFKANLFANCLLEKKKVARPNHFLFNT